MKINVIDKSTGTWVLDALDPAQWACQHDHVEQEEAASPYVGNYDTMEVKFAEGYVYVCRDCGEVMDNDDTSDWGDYDD